MNVDYENGAEVSATGRIEDVAAFFRKSRRTVEDWVLDGKIECFKAGGSVRFLEQDVIDFSRAQGRRAEDVRREWREHMGRRAGIQQKVTKITKEAA